MVKFAVSFIGKVVEVKPLIYVMVFWAVLRDPLFAPLRILLFDHTTYCNGLYAELLRILQGQTAETGQNPTAKIYIVGECTHSGEKRPLMSFIPKPRQEPRR